MMSNMDFDGLRFVVARYNEDISWVSALVSRFPGSKCTVYNKGRGDLEKSSTYDVVDLENVGRESHTYLRHVISTYSQESDEVTVFLQGHPFDHCHGCELFDLVHSGVGKIMEGSLFENIGTQMITIHRGVPTFHLSIERELSQTSQDLFGTSLPESFQFSAGAMFVTCRSSVLKRPLLFYKKAVSMLDSDVNPVRGFCFERLWSLIFS